MDEARASAAKIEDDARIRKARLREEIRLLQERIAWAQDGLRDVTARLLIDTEPADEPEQTESA